MSMLFDCKPVLVKPFFGMCLQTYDYLSYSTSVDVCALQYDMLSLVESADVWDRQALLYHYVRTPFDDANRLCVFEAKHLTCVMKTSILLRVHQ